MEKIFLTKDMDAFQKGAFEAFEDVADALIRASKLNFRGFIFIGKIKTIKEITVFYQDKDCNLHHRNFDFDSEDSESYNMCVLVNFINSHEINSVHKSIAYTIEDTKIFSVDFESTLDPHNIEHL